MLTNAWNSGPEVHGSSRISATRLRSWGSESSANRASGTPAQTMATCSSFDRKRSNWRNRRCCRGLPTRIELISSIHEHSRAKLAQHCERSSRLHAQHVPARR